MMLRACLTTLLLVTVGAHATTPPLSVRPAGVAVQVDVSATLPNLILSAQQVVLYAPALQRADVAEAVRRAITERGTQVYLITNRSSLFTDNSYSFRLLLMKVPTYLTASQGTPFVLIDGRAVTGPGVTGPGRATIAARADTAELTTWVERVTRAVKPVDAVQAVRTWVKEKYGVTLR